MIRCKRKCRCQLGRCRAKKSVIAHTLHYVNTLRGHMQWEELDLVRRVEEMVSDIRSIG